MSLTIETSERELQQFSRQVSGSSAVEVVGPAERRCRWNAHGCSGSVTSTFLRCGMALSHSTVRWQRPWSVSVDQGASSLKFVLLRGRGPRLTTSDGDEHSLDGGMLHVARVNRPVGMTFAFDASPEPALHEELSVEVEPQRLVELLGGPGLPGWIERLLASPRAYPSVAVPMSPTLLSRFDDVADDDSRPRTRALRWEALGLGLVATAIDRIEESARAEAHLPAQDRDRLETARRLLLSRMADPPSMRELARAVGLNEFKLKVGFRTLFGRPVFAYLRDQRMRKARQLLGEGRHTVTEVALRVGYANPSKFAAAFRKRFGVRPSDVG